MPSENTTLLMPLLDSSSMFEDDMGVPRPKTHIVIVCTSSAGAFQRRDSVRQTWYTFARDLPVTVIFLVGVTENRTVQTQLENESKLHSDILQERFVDTYQNLTLKSMFMLKFAQTHLVNKTQWVLKVDDDCYVDVRVLLHYTRTIRKSHDFL